MVPRMLIGVIEMNKLAYRLPLVAFFIIEMLAFVENKVKKTTSSEANSVKSNKDDLKIEFVDYKTPEPSSESVYLFDPFDDLADFKQKWIKSESTKGGSNEYRYNGTWDLVVTHGRIRGRIKSTVNQFLLRPFLFSGDYGLRMKNKSRFHAIARKLDKVFQFQDQDLIVQYDVQYRHGLDCGGAYIKLLTKPSGDLKSLSDKTLYSIMFGPDKCGGDHKLHFIFSHKNPVTGNTREIHWKKSHTVNQLGDAVADLKWHVFRLHLRPDNSFEIFMDKRSVGKGSLLTDFSPEVNADKGKFIFR